MSGIHLSVTNDQWNPAKVWKGSECQICSYCKGKVKVGDMSKQNATTGYILHDDCAEDIGAYNGR